MKNIILSAALLSSMLTFSQVGVDTTNPQAKLHVDGAKDNPVTGVPTTTQQLNDFAVTSDGSVGIGITAPTAPLTFPRVTGRKISLYNTTVTPPNDHQYNGFGMEVGYLVNQVSSTAGKFVWRAGTSSTASNSVMLLTGTGNLGLGTINPGNMLTVNGGKFQYTDGTEGNTNVLTSDASGVASWKAPATNLFYGNLGSGVSLSPAAANGPYFYSGSSVTLPPGKWLVDATFILSKGSGSVVYTGNTESWWINSTFSDSNSVFGYTTDFQGTSNLISGLLPPSSPWAFMNGAVVINNTSGANKTYYYWVGGVYSNNATGNLYGVGGGPSAGWNQTKITYLAIN